MSLDCFDGLVGLGSSCGSSPPLLPLEARGVDESLLTAFTGKETDVQTLIHYAEMQARHEIAARVITHYSRRILPVTFLHRRRVGEPNKSHLPESNTGINGILIEVNQPRANTSLILTGWQYFAFGAQSATISIYDLADGTLLNKTVVMPSATDAIANNEAVITIPIRRRLGRFLVTHDQAQWRKMVIGAGCTSCTGSSINFGGVKISGAHLPQGASINRSNVRSTSSTAGLSLIASLVCDHTQLLCEYRDLFAPAYAAKVAQILFQRGLEAVDRLNSHTINREALEERRDIAMADYQAQMNGLLSHLHIPGDDVCFTCNAPVIHTKTLPG